MPATRYLLPLEELFREYFRDRYDRLVEAFVPDVRIIAPLSLERMEDREMEEFLRSRVFLVEKEGQKQVLHLEIFRYPRPQIDLLIFRAGEALGRFLKDSPYAGLPVCHFVVFLEPGPFLTNPVD